MSYNGIKIPYVAGRGGFNANDNIDDVPPTDLIEAKNIRYDGNAWRKVGGLTAFDSTGVSGAPVALAGYDWWPTTSAQSQVTFWSDGKVYKSSGSDSDATTLVSSLAVSSPATFLACGAESVGNNRKLLLFESGQTPYVLDGTGSSMAAISNVSADWSGSGPRGGIVHDGRVCAWFGHNIYFSTLNDHTDFTTGNPPVFTIAGGEGEYITSCFSQGTTRMFISKHPGGLYFIDTANITSYWLPVTTIRTDIGIAGPRALDRVGSLGTWFIANDGHVYNLEMLTNPDVDMKDADITAQLNLVPWIEDNVKVSRLNYAQLIYDPARKEVWAFYTNSTGTYNNRALVFNVAYPNKIRVSVEDRGSYFNAAWLVKENSYSRGMYVAGESGIIYKANQSTRSIVLPE